MNLLELIALIFAALAELILLLSEKGVITPREMADSARFRAVIRYVSASARKEDTTNDRLL